MHSPLGRRSRTTLPVSFPDTVTPAHGTPLVLNGSGVRRKFWVDVYVGGLYLPVRTTDAARAIHDDLPKRIVMQFVYRRVTRKQLVDTFRDSVSKAPDAAALLSQLDILAAMIERDVVAGETLILDYAPGDGIRFQFDGQERGPIPGVAFMRAIWSVFLGPRPASEDLKAGMLGS